jgi:glycosyltransferase involved in cell wall biosynthesis
VSIILPTIGRPDSLQRAVASVLGQTTAEFEVLVVDNNKGGGGEVAARALGGGDPRLRVLRAPAATNAAGARNVGLAQARGRYITFLDDDDTYRPDKVTQQLALARSSGSPMVLCGGCFHVRGRRRNRYTKSAIVGGDELLTAAGLGTPFLFYRGEAAVRFDETFDAGEDQHFAHALLAAFDLRSVPVVPLPLVDVFQGIDAGPRTNLNGEAAWRAARRIWWQFGGRFSPEGRRTFVLQSRVARYKLRGDWRGILRLAPVLLRCGGAREIRFLGNALVVGLQLGRGRWVT